MVDPLRPRWSKRILERREMGALNIFGPGQILVDGKTYELDYQDYLYRGMEANG